MRLAKATASSRSLKISDSGTGWLIFFIASLNSSRSSACLIASRVVPRSFTPYSSNTPASDNCTAILRPTWPPNVANKPQGRSFLITSVTNSRLIGSTYTRSAISVSVIIVAGLELTNTTL